MEALPVIDCRGLVKEFPGRPRPTRALDGLDFRAEAGGILGLLGPDGAGKTTLLRLLTGLLRPTAGTLRVLGFDPVSEADDLQAAIGYMPQKFGLYTDLSVAENLTLYAELRAVPHAIRPDRFRRLLDLTMLAPFTTRLAGRLSGGMKQKLALACTLVAMPRLLLLDEPTVGIDVLSRRELWTILRQLADREGISIVASTAYLDEAGYCDRALILEAGRVLAAGTPARIAALADGAVREITVPDRLRPRRLQRYLDALPGTVHAAINGRRVRYVVDRTAGDPPPAALPWPAVAVAPRFEEGFLLALHRSGRTTRNVPAPSEPLPAVPEPETAEAGNAPVVIRVDGLVKRFGTFTAVDHVSFEVRRGEIFGLLGANGAGKSTTFRMLCGLSRADGGTLEVAGENLRLAAVSARRKLGFVAQKFSLYGDLNVRENLAFFGGAYGLHGDRLRRRIDHALAAFELEAYRRTPAAALPGGCKQRLSMACALLHEPEILFLDEPTSGADPLARRAFWRRINALADTGMTVIITTHFLDEAEYCDRMVIMLDGAVPAAGTPAEIRRLGATPDNPSPSLEDAFAAIIRRHRRERGKP